MSMSFDYVIAGGGSAGCALAARLRAALADGRLKVECWPFYTGSLAFWEMPVPLRIPWRLWRVPPHRR